MQLKRLAIPALAALMLLPLAAPLRAETAPAPQSPLRLAQAGGPTNIDPSQGATPRAYGEPSPEQEQGYDNDYGTYQGGGSQGGNTYQGGGDSYQGNTYQPGNTYQGGGNSYQSPPAGNYNSDTYGRSYDDGPGRPYEPVPPAGPQENYVPPEAQQNNGFSVDEITEAGHRFFGTVSHDLAKVIEYAFQRRGRPNGYILGEEAGGAFVAGLRYGEGTLYTKDAGTHQVFWQGPSVGYDFGGEGSKTMVLVYDLRDPNQIYQKFAGVDGSAYLIGGVGITFLTKDSIVLAPIRSGVGLRLGANIGYLKYTRQPTWNPF
ncbi:hypothetical protein A7A08_01745 [Methyloligella halotolerans]|uniref:DUF1134 domain-containing protein n=1 Tax=Methyloligella halotolerans TaxID=1177755 RepID=A0A1E2RZX2_9HYPH|nr:hypothetical protein A7A08_01745 [Methyloligella halotolerans]